MAERLQREALGGFAAVRYGRTCSGHAIRNPGNALRFSHVAFDTPQSRTILRRLAGTLAISVMLMRHEGNGEIGAQDGRNDAKLRDS